jgi:hypothetical protein
MALTFKEINERTEDARQTLKNADLLAGNIASFLIGRLKNVSPYTLAKLKKELQNFNSHTHYWK